MGRAYGAICGSCSTEVTVLESQGRVGVSPSANHHDGPVDEDATIPGVVQFGDDGWPPCPACGEFTLARNPNSTDVLMPDDAIQPADTMERRRWIDAPAVSPRP